MQKTKFNFVSRLKSLPSVNNVVGDYSGSDADQAKKCARIKASTLNTNDKLGFLHCCLIKVSDKHFLIAGPSGSGKSTIAKYLSDKVGALVLANDWITAELDNGNIYVSDLNLSENFLHTNRCKLDGIIFLSNTDNLVRDAYIPDIKQFSSLIYSSFDGVDSSATGKLGRFWQQNRSTVPFYCVVSTQDVNPDFSSDTVTRIFQRMFLPNDFIEVGIIGTGAIGSALAAQIGQISHVKKVHLYNRSKGTAVGLALDLNHAAFRGKSDIYVAHDDVSEVFKRSSSIFFAFRDKDAKNQLNDVPERLKKIVAHTKIIQEYSRLAAKHCFMGTIFVITNPVDFLSYACYDATKNETFSLRSFQVYGVGLEADLARAVFYGRQRDSSFSSSRFELYGNHTDDFYSIGDLSVDTSDSLIKSVKGATHEVKQFDIRTIYGPVQAAVRNYSAFIHNKTTNLTLIQENAYIGRKVGFKGGLPCLSRSIDNTEYSKLIANNRELINKYLK